jgi:hypothetical protein
MRSFVLLVEGASVTMFATTWAVKWSHDLLPLAKCSTPTLLETHITASLQSSWHSPTCQGAANLREDLADSIAAQHTLKVMMPDNAMLASGRYKHDVRTEPLVELYRRHGKD